MLPQLLSPHGGHNHLQVDTGIDLREDIGYYVHLINPLHEQVQIPILPPPLLNQVPVSGVAHVGHRISNLPPDLREVNPALDLENVQLLAHVLQLPVKQSLCFTIGLLPFSLLCGNGGGKHLRLCLNISRVLFDVLESLVECGDDARCNGSVPLSGIAEGDRCTFQGLALRPASGLRLALCGSRGSGRNLRVRGGRGCGWRRRWTSSAGGGCGAQGRVPPTKSEGPCGCT